MKRKMVFSFIRGSLGLVFGGGGKGNVVRAEAVLLVAPFLTFPHPPTHVVKVVGQYYSQRVCVCGPIKSNEYCIYHMSIRL